MEQNGHVDDSKQDDTHKGISWLRSARWRFSILLFFIHILLYMHRVNLSLAVVCMTKDPTDRAHAESNGSTSTTHNDTVRFNLTDFGVTSDTFHYNTTLNTYNVITTATEILKGPENISSEDDHCVEGSLGKKKEFEPELNWDNTHVSFLLSSYFYGSFFSQVPGGRLADRFGGKHIITGTMLLTAACSLLTPVCARASIWLMFVVRILIGLAGGAIIPVGMAMMSVWAPPEERSTMIAFSASGLSVGTIISYQTSGLLCVYGFDNGWASIFYIQGAFALLVTLVWCYEVSSKPSKHPRISKSELDYIHGAIVHGAKKAARKIPWKGILTSKPMWGSVICHFSYNWSFFTVLITVPLFLKEVLKFDVKENGVFSSLPYVCNMTFVIISGKLSAVIIRRKLLSHLLTRRLFTLVSMTGFGTCLILAGYLTCELRHVSVALLCLSCVFAGLIFGGFITNHAEFAGQYAGTVYGITNASGVISALLSSLFAGLLTPNGTQEEWQVVFYIAAGIDLFGALAFVFCASVTLEPWARKGSNLEIEVEESRKEQELQTLNPDTNNEKIT